MESSAKPSIGFPNMLGIGCCTTYLEDKDECLVGLPNSLMWKIKMKFSVLKYSQKIAISAQTVWYLCFPIGIDLLLALP